MVEVARIGILLPGAGDPQQLSARRCPSELHRRARRFVLLGLAARLDRASARAPTRSALRRKHLLSRNRNAGLLGCDSAARDRRLAAALVRRRSHCRLQHRPDRGVHAQRNRRVLPRPISHGIDGGRPRRWQHLRLLAAPFRPLRSPRDAVCLLDPVGRARLAQGDRERVGTWLPAGRRAGGGASPQLHLLRRVPADVAWCVNRVQVLARPIASAEDRCAHAGTAARHPGDLLDSLPSQPREGWRPPDERCEGVQRVGERFPEHAGDQSPLWLVRRRLVLPNGISSPGLS